MQKLLFFLLLFFSINAFSQSKEKSTTTSVVEESEEFPPNYSWTNSILVYFNDYRKDVNRNIKKSLEKNYLGDYRILETGENISPKDTSKPVFVIFVSDRTGTSFLGSNREYNTHYTISLMTNGKEYKFKESSQCDACLFKQYFKKLEKLRSGTN